LRIAQGDSLIGMDASPSVLARRSRLGIAQEDSLIGMDASPSVLARRSRLGIGLTDSKTAMKASPASVRFELPRTPPASRSLSPA
jgi:hypothetical protein